MTLPSSGPLSASMIRDEFNGVNPFRLSDYYAGGPYVPAGTSGVNGPVPTAGTIRFSHFYGTSNALIHALTVGADSSLRGFVFGDFGAVAPTTLFGIPLVQITSSISAPLISIGVEGVQVQTFWTSVAIAGGPTLISANADGFVPAINTTWIFSDAFKFSGTNYTMEFL